MFRQIFRQDALDKLSTPDRLDHLMQVTTPKGWMALLALCVLVGSGLVWSVLGSIPTTVSGRGVLLSVNSTEKVEGQPDLQVIAFVSVAASGKIKPGLKARISPATIRVEEYGYIIGETGSVSALPVTQKKMMSILENELLVEYLSDGQIHYTLDVKLDGDPSTYTGLRWSSPKGPSMSVRPGTLCEVSVVVEENRPISLVLPIMQSLLNFQRLSIFKS